MDPKKESLQTGTTLQYPKENTLITTTDTYMNASFPSSTEGNGVTPTIEEVNLRQDNMETGLHNGIGMLNTD